MNQEKWQETKEQIRHNFKEVEEYQEDLDPGEADILEFDGPSGRLKVQFVTRPKLLDKKTAYSNRPGADIKVDYVFSDKEFVSHLEVYSWSEGSDDWQKIDGESLF